MQTGTPLRNVYGTEQTDRIGVHLDFTPNNRIKEITSSPFYWGKRDRQEAQKILQNHRNRFALISGNGFHVVCCYYYEKQWRVGCDQLQVTAEGRLQVGENDWANFAEFLKSADQLGLKGLKPISSKQRWWLCLALLVPCAAIYLGRELKTRFSSP